jgi:hypothetical protein
MFGLKSKATTDGLKTKVEYLQTRCSDLERDVWKLQNHPLFQYGDMVGKYKIVDVLYDEHVQSYTPYIFRKWQYMIDTGEALLTVDEDFIINANLENQ